MSPLERIGMEAKHNPKAMRELRAQAWFMSRWWGAKDDFAQASIDRYFDYLLYQELYEAASEVENEFSYVI